MSIHPPSAEQKAVRELIEAAVTSDLVAFSTGLPELRNAKIVPTILVLNGPKQPLPQLQIAFAWPSTPWNDNPVEHVAALDAFKLGCWIDCDIPSVDTKRLIGSVIFGTHPVVAAAQLKNHMRLNGDGSAAINKVCEQAAAFYLFGPAALETGEPGQQG